MADEQFVLSVEQLSESVRTSMTKDDAGEYLVKISELFDRESADSETRPHELMGQVLRSLLPAFIMTDADFKTPASLAAPSKPMHAVRDQCVEWLLGVVKSNPNLATPIEVNLVAYRRRLGMAALAGEDDDDEDQQEGEESEEEDMSDSENNLPPNSETPKQGKKGKSRSKKASGDIAGSGAVASTAVVVLDPVVALLERLAVRCPDKAEWRRSVCDTICSIASALRANRVGDRYIDSFLVALLSSEKAAWRVFASEAIASLAPILVVPTSFGKVAARTRDIAPMVRSAAMKSTLALLAQSPDPARLDVVVSIILERARDEKPTVRRSTLSIFDQLVSFTALESLPLSILDALCMDESLMVRKSSIASISGLTARYPEDQRVADLWAKNVLHMVMDVESSVAEKAVESIETGFCAMAAKFGGGRTTGEAPEGLVVVVKAIGASRDTTEFARRILRILARKGEVNVKQITSGLDRLVSVEPGVASTALALMEELVTTVQNSQLLAPLRALALVESVTSQPEAFVHALRVLQVVVAKKGAVDSIAGTPEFTHLLQLLRETVQDRPAGTVPLSVQHEVVKSLHACVGLQASPSSVKGEFEQLLFSAEQVLDSVISGSFERGEAALKSHAWHMSLVGELALLSFMPSAKGLVAVEAIATNRVYQDGTVHCAQPASLRAAAMLTFGRICLQKESIAKRAVSKLAAHLSRDEHPSVRNNVLVVLQDLCIVYTGLVDQYLPWLTTCLSDPNDLIRMQAAVVVSSLLAEDYIKFKGQIVFRLLYLLSDADLRIRQFTESVFARILFLRHSGSLKSLFAETVCALNGYSRHPAFQGATGNKEFYLTANPNRRKEVYKFMLTNVTEAEKKFNAMMQLANVLLAAFVDEDATGGAVTIPDREDSPAGQVLIDTLWLLSCKELRLAQGVGAVDGGDEGSAQDKDARAHQMLAAAMQKKAVVDSIVPLLVQLNRTCEQRRSPMSRYVRDCLREVVKEYKDELSTILQADPQLLQEMEYDLNVANSADQGATTAVDPPTAEPAAMTPGGPRPSSPKSNAKGVAESVRSVVGSAVKAPSLRVSSSGSEAEVPVPKRGRRGKPAPVEEPVKPRGRRAPVKAEESEDDDGESSASEEVVKTEENSDAEEEEAPKKRGGRGAKPSAAKPPAKGRKRKVSN